MTISVTPRALEPQERALAEFLLSRAFAGRDDLKAQLDSAEVVGLCECGCGTIDLAVSPSATPAVCREPIPVEAHGSGIEVLLFVRAGRLSSLEIVDYENIRPLAYPRPSDLTLFLPGPLKSSTA